MYLIEQLQLKADGRPSARRAQVGRAWRAIGKPVARLADAEAIERGIRTNGPTIIRIRPVRA